MSKVDAQRAMREAKYARTQASGPTRREAAAAAASANDPAAGPTAAKPAPAVAKAAKAPKAAKAATSTTAAATQGELCGHKSMNGRACTREAGHPEKSHRYT